MADKCDRCVIFDPRGLIDDPQGERVRDAGEFDDAAIDFSEGTLRELIVTPDADTQRLFDHVAGRVKVWSATLHGSLMFVVDEARFVQLMDSRAFEWLMRAAPADRVHLAITCHRPADIPTDVRAIGDHWLLFQCTQEHDLKVIEQRCGPKVESAVRALAPREFVHWDDAKGSYQIFRNPKAWYVPLGSPRSSGGELVLTPAGGESPVDTSKLFD